MVDEEFSDVRRKKYEELNKSLKKKAEGGIQWGAGIMKNMNEISDAASLGIEAAKHGTPFGDWELAISTVERLEEDLDRMYPVMKLYGDMHFMISSSSTSVVSSGSALVSGTSDRFRSETEWKSAAKVNSDYEKYFEKYDLKDSVLKLLADLGFDSSKRGMKAIEKFKRGWEMYYIDPPDADASIGSAIPLRQSIVLSINELIALRPIQREAKRKIIEIGLQLKADFVRPEVFDEMEQKYPKLVDELSGTKNELFPRTIRFELMRDGTLFLRQLLSSVDPKKLRKRRRTTA